MYLLTKTCYIYKLDRKLFSEASGKNIAFDWILGYNKLNDKKKSDILKYHRYSRLLTNGTFSKRGCHFYSLIGMAFLSHMNYFQDAQMI